MNGQPASGMSEDPETMQDRNRVKLERLELALRASNEGIWDWQTDEQEIFYSRRILEFLECGRDHAPNLFLAPFDHVWPEDREVFERAVTHALLDGGPETLVVDARIRSGGDHWLWLRIRGTVVRRRDGRTIRIAGSMIDISRRKAAEAQVEEERFLLRQLIDRVPLQIYFKDLESKFTMANQRMAEWLGLTHGSQLTGKHDRDFFDLDHWKPAEDDEKRIILSGEAILDQLEHETWCQGDETWVITSKFPWRDRIGQIKGTFGVSSDVTKLVKAQHEASTLAHQLQVKNEAYEEELLLAREIQQALAGEGFPAATSSNQNHLTFGARYIPISGLAGDFFEVMMTKGLSRSHAHPAPSNGGVPQRFHRLRPPASRAGRSKARRPNWPGPNPAIPSHASEALQVSWQDVSPRRGRCRDVKTDATNGWHRGIHKGRGRLALVHIQGAGTASFDVSL